MRFKVGLQRQWQWLLYSERFFDQDYVKRVLLIGAKYLSLITYQSGLQKIIAMAMTVGFYPNWAMINNYKNVNVSLTVTVGLCN